MQVADKVGIQHMFFLAGIAHVLLAHILRLQRYFKILILIAQTVVPDKVWGKGDGSISVMNFPFLPSGILVLIKRFGKIPDAVTAPGGIGIP